MVLGMNVCGNTIIDETANITPTDYSGCIDFNEAAFQAMRECDVNFSNYNNSLIQYELAYLQENGVEVVYEEGKVKGIVDKGVAMVKSWFSKVMGIIQQFMTSMSAKIATMTKSLGVNMKKLKDAKSYKLKKEFEDYDYATIMKSKIDKASFISVTNQNAIGSVADAKDYEDAIKGVIAAAKRGMTGGSDVTVKNIITHICGEKVKFSSSDNHGADAKWCYDTINGFKDAVKRVNETKKSVKEAANAAIKQIKSAAKNIKSGDSESANDDAKAVHATITVVNQANSMNTMLVTAKLNIMIGALGLAKRMAHAYIGGGDGKDTKEEEKPAAAEEVKEESAFLGFELV